MLDLKAWIYACIDRYADEPPTNAHDQLTYTTGWEPYQLASTDEHVLSFLTNARNQVAAHFTQTDQWRHGYWRMQEAHHGTEHFELFLGLMARLDPADSTTCTQVIDAVEHVGNWSPYVPAWFDHSTGLFRSLYFGTDGIREDQDQLNMPDHLRCANLLMLAHSIAKEPKYLQLADAYAGRWADAICSRDDTLPIGITRHGVIYEFTDAGEATYRSFVGMAGKLDTALDRAENVLASGGIQLFLSLWQATQSARYLNAAKRLLEVLSSELTDPDAGPVADAIRSFRKITGIRDFDDRVIQAIDGLRPFEIKSLGMSLPEPLRSRPAGVGKRADMPTWHENGKPRRHNPILLSVAAEILQDNGLATCAVDLAHAYFSIATANLPDGRDHGCAARTVSAIARGHGRNNHAGMTTAVLLPAMLL